MGVIEWWVIKLTLAGVLFQTITECPEWIKFLTIPDPIIPRPKNPNFNWDGDISLSLSVLVIFSKSIGGVSLNKTVQYWF